MATIPETVSVMLKSEFDPKGNEDAKRSYREVKEAADDAADATSGGGSQSKQHGFAQGFKDLGTIIKTEATWQADRLKNLFTFSNAESRINQDKIKSLSAEETALRRIYDLEKRKLELKEIIKESGRKGKEDFEGFRERKGLENELEGIENELSSDGGASRGRGITRTAALQFMTGGSRGWAYGMLGQGVNALQSQNMGAVGFGTAVGLGYLGYKEMQFVQQAWDANKNWSRNSMPLAMMMGDRTAIKGFDDRLLDNATSNLLSNDIKGDKFVEIISSLMRLAPEKTLGYGQKYSPINSILDNLTNFGLDQSQYSKMVTGLSLRTGQRIGADTILSRLESGVFNGMPSGDTGTIGIAALQTVLENTANSANVVGSRVGLLGGSDISRINAFSGRLYQYDNGKYRQDAGSIMQMLDSSGKNFSDPMTMMVAMQQNGGSMEKAYRDIQKGGLINNINQGKIQMFRKMGMPNWLIEMSMNEATGGQHAGFWKDYVSGRFDDEQLKKFYPSLTAEKDIAAMVEGRDTSRRASQGFLAGTSERGTEALQLVAGRNLGETFASSLETLAGMLNQVSPYLGTVASAAREYERVRAGNNRLKGAVSKASLDLQSGGGNPTVSP